MADLSAFANAQSRTDQQKKDLLAALAEQGSAGRASFDQAQSEIAQAREAAVNEAASRSGLISAPGEYMAEQRARVGSGADLAQTDLSRGRATFGADIARQGAANEEHFSRLGAAIPLVESRTKAAVEQIIREQEDAKAAREQEMLMRQQDSKDKDEDRTFQREMRGMALAEARANAVSSGNKRGGRSGGGLTLSESLKMQDRSTADMMKRSQQFVLSNLGKASANTQQLFYRAIKGKNFGDAASIVASIDPSKVDTRGVSQAALMDWVRRYYEPTDDELGMALGLIPVPTSRSVPAGPKILGAQPARRTF